MSVGKRRAPLRRSPQPPRQPAKGAGGLRPLKAIKRKPMKRKKRSAEDALAKFAREYGSADRVEWIRWHGCLACARVPSENAHTANDGTGRKGPASSIVPLCTQHHLESHRGVKSFEAKHAAMLGGRTLASWAETYAEAWAKWSGEVAS
jgi:hypothetical protein